MTESGAKALFEDTGIVVIGGVDAEEADRLAEALRSARCHVVLAGDEAPASRPDVALWRAAFVAEEADDAEDTPDISPWPAWLKEQRVAVVALIPAARPDYIDRALAAGAIEVLLLPANADETRMRVRKVLRLVALEAEAARLGLTAEDAGDNGE